MGLAVGDPYTGPEEAWLIVNGYAKAAAPSAYANTFTVAPGNDNQVDYTGDITPDGLLTLDAGGQAAGVLPVSDPTLAANREDAGEIDGLPYAARLDANADGLAVFSVEPNEGPAAGGTPVTVTGFGFTGVTGVTFDGAAGTAFSVVSDTEIAVTTPAGIAGPADIAATEGASTDTLVGGFTYTA
ncbi:IPT/TIG domain-containing protein [Nocardioides panzhihuensis]|uniref:IPT/TIG domain-containing protein n=1 Tax=Nocardioides panzhihuensis TaxID=860243 RepID=A0A7Z0IR47_9ACTN|nr:IPT/TIG domain-containing protein [Nocardioides panzhihuensis]NYI76624.1 hypothetical protein [Nocardioides panzhihuensis]